MKRIKIDGAMGEGGGQILRSALTLAMLYQIPIEVVNIRAKRNKPGLLRQHLTCVRAAQAICSADVKGDQLGSQHIVFTPDKVKSGEYHFAIGTAGSTVLVCQTILLPLALASGDSKVTFEGGTHNGNAPSVTFLQQSFLPILQQMGVQTSVQLERYGFYPAGGGKWSIEIKAVAELSAFKLASCEAEVTDFAEQLQLTAIVSNLPISIAEREIKAVMKKLDAENLPSRKLDVHSAGPGNLLSLCLDQGSHCSVFERVGELGTSAENVAKRTAGRLLKLLSAAVAVEEHLADQLLLPMLLAGRGVFTTTQPSLHSKTNIEVIRQITGSRIETEQLSQTSWRISLNENAIKLEGA